MDGSGGIRVCFWGVRGSTPCSGDQYLRYGGNSSCVVLEVDGQSPIVFDLGTGLRPYGDALGGAAHPYQGTMLLTHFHWDHIQGLPFFSPLQHPDSLVNIYGPRQGAADLGDVFAGMMQPPYFPITPAHLAGEIRWHALDDDDFPINNAKVRARYVRHVGATLGYRVEWNGAVVVYISDHGQGCGEPDCDDYVPQEVVELCDGADLVIHDAQHAPSEFEAKRAWGHCTNEYALLVAHTARARQLALFHHCPSHGDDMIDSMLRSTQQISAQTGGPDVIAAAEGLVITVGGER